MGKSGTSTRWRNNDSNSSQFCIVSVDNISICLRAARKEEEMKTKAEIAARTRNYRSEHRDIIELLLNIMDRLDSLCLKGADGRNVGIQIRELADYISKSKENKLSIAELFEKYLEYKTTGRLVLYDVPGYPELAGKLVFTATEMRLIGEGDEKALAFIINITGNEQGSAQLFNIIEKHLYSKIAIETLKTEELRLFVTYFHRLIRTSSMTQPGQRFNPVTYHCTVTFKEQLLEETLKSKR